MALDGLAGFDDALTGRLTHCTACGGWEDPDLLIGQLVALAAVQVEVFLVLCRACARQWERIEPLVLAKLHQRYGAKGKVDNLPTLKKG